MPRYQIVFNTAPVVNSVPNSFVNYAMNRRYVKIRLDRFQQAGFKLVSTDWRVPSTVLEHPNPAAITHFIMLNPDMEFVVTDYV